MLKIRNIILTMALMGCLGLAFGQTVEQRIGFLADAHRTADHPAPQGYSPKVVQKVVMPSFKPQDQIIPGVEVVEQSKGILRRWATTTWW